MHLAKKGITVIIRILKTTKGGAMKIEEVNTWRQIIKDWEMSKQPQRQYCRENNIKYSTFKGWRYRILGKGGNKIKTLLGKLLPIKIKGDSETEQLLPSGVELRVNKVIIHIPQMTMKQLKEVIGIL